LKITKLPISYITMPSSERALEWALFFALALGLGYAAVTRYDPRDVAGLRDSLVYTGVVIGQPPEDEARLRILVPSVAKAFYGFALHAVGQDRAPLLALLIANCLFCATSASLLAGIGRMVTMDRAIGVLGASLYLLSFPIPNLHLAGLIDAGEGCFLLATVWALITGRVWLMPALAIPGALAKETFVPLATALAIGWWLARRRADPRAFTGLIGAGAMAVVGVLTVVSLRWIEAGQLQWPWHIVRMQPGAGIGTWLGETFVNRSFWYPFVTLLAFGVWRLPRLPRAWIVASTCASVVALALGMYKGAAVNVARPIFNLIGPPLSLSTALLVAGGWRRE
jgi:hypothetical protein